MTPILAPHRRRPPDSSCSDQAFRMTTLFPQPYLINRSHSEPPPLPPAIEEDLNTFPSLPQTHSAYPTLRPLSIPFPEAVPSSLSAREALGHQSTITGKAPSPVRSGTPGPPPVAKQWLHRSSNPHFLPPATSTPPALALLDDSLDLFREYRECVENVVKVQADYGRNLGSAIKKLENKLAQLHTGVPGEKKVPPRSVDSLSSQPIAHRPQHSTDGAKWTSAASINRCESPRQACRGHG